MPRTKRNPTKDVGKSSHSKKTSDKRNPETKQTNRSQNKSNSHSKQPSLSSSTVNGGLAQVNTLESSIGHYTFTHRSTDNYINLTKMLRQVGKNVNDYMDLKSTLAYIQYVSNQVSIPVENLVYVGRGRVGTWAHPIIATHASQWASHEMSYAVAQLVDRFRNADARLALDVVSRTNDDLDGSVGQAIAETTLGKMSESTQERLMARQAIKMTTTSLNKALASAQTSRKVYGAVQNAITYSLYEKKVNELKAEKGVPYEIPLRESLDTDELVEMAYVELITRKAIQTDTSIKGDNACIEVSTRSAEMVRQLTRYSSTPQLPVQGNLFDVEAVSVTDAETEAVAI